MDETVYDRFGYVRVNCGRTGNISGRCNIGNGSNDKRSAYHGNLDYDSLFYRMGTVRNIFCEQNGENRAQIV